MSVREKEISEGKEIMPTGPKGLVYLYCVTKTKPNGVNSENVGAQIYSIDSDGVYAIVRKVSLDDFSEERLKEKLSDMNWIEQKVLEHENMIEKIMQHTTVIPFKFPTIFHTEENVRKLLRQRGREFRETIAYLENREEWGLKIYCDMREFKESIAKEDKRIKEKEQEISFASKGKAYFLKKKKDELVKEKISEYMKDCFERLKRPCLETKINRILPKEVTEKDHEMVFNVAFLINKNRIKDFENGLSYLKTKYSDKGLIFDCTGPWPAYNFCQMKPELTERSERKFAG